MCVEMANHVFVSLLLSLALLEVHSTYLQIQQQVQLLNYWGQRPWHFQVAQRLQHVIHFEDTVIFWLESN